MNAFSPRSVLGLLNPIALALLPAMNMHAADKILFDFQSSANTAAWEIVNDDVMGGLSRGGLHLTNGVAVFQGQVSLDNNGGFASVRSLPARHELAGSDAFLIRVRGDGRSYKFTARFHSRDFVSPEISGDTHTGRKARKTCFINTL